MVGTTGTELKIRATFFGLPVPVFLIERVSLQTLHLFRDSDPLTVTLTQKLGIHCHSSYIQFKSFNTRYNPGTS